MLRIGLTTELCISIVLQQAYDYLLQLWTFFMGYAVL